MAITTTPLKEEYEEISALYEEMIFETTPYLWARALDRISEDELAELERRLDDICELENQQLALLEKLLPDQRGEVARSRFRGNHPKPEATRDDGEDVDDDSWLDVRLRVMCAESDLKDMMQRLAILRRAELVAHRNSSRW